MPLRSLLRTSASEKETSTLGTLRCIVKSYRSYQDFTVSVSKHWRFTRDTEQTDFLETVLSTGADKAEELQAVNPKGMPCLYVATHEETAIAEVGAWVGALVSVAQLKISRVLRLMNCTTDDHRIMLYGGEPDAAERDRAVWRDIDRAFSSPVTASDNLASHVPTQVLAEVFRRNGFDGVAYRSSLGSGHNLALFDLDAADVINCTLVQIDPLKLTYSQAANRYFVLEAPRSGTVEEIAEYLLALETCYRYLCVFHEWVDDVVDDDWRRWFRFTALGLYLLHPTSLSRLSRYCRSQPYSFSPLDSGSFWAP